jgi:hypothetical protein
MCPPEQAPYRPTRLIVYHHLDTTLFRNVLFVPRSFNNLEGKAKVDHPFEHLTYLTSNQRMPFTALAGSCVPANLTSQLPLANDL